MSEIIDEAEHKIGMTPELANAILTTMKAAEAAHELAKGTGWEEFTRKVWVEAAHYARVSEAAKFARAKPVKGEANGRKDTGD